MSRRSARSFAAFRAGYGAALLWSPGPLTQAAAGQATGPATRTIARVLGLRQLLQAVITSGDPSPRALMFGAATDAAHAASMAALALTDRRWRRAALLDAFAAATLAAIGLHAARRARPGKTQASGPRRAAGRKRREATMTQATHACTTVESVTASVYQIPRCGGITDWLRAAKKADADRYRRA